MGGMKTLDIQFVPQGLQSRQVATLHLNSRIKNKGCIAVDCDAAFVVLSIIPRRSPPGSAGGAVCGMLLLAFEDLLTTHDVETCGEVVEAFACAHLDALEVVDRIVGLSLVGCHTCDAAEVLHCDCCCGSLAFCSDGECCFASSLEVKLNGNHTFTGDFHIAVHLGNRLVGCAELHEPGTDFFGQVEAFIFHYNIDCGACCAFIFGGVATEIEGGCFLEVEGGGARLRDSTGQQQLRRQRSQGW